MKLHASGLTGRNTFTGYGPGFVLVNNARHEASLIVLPEQVLPWKSDGFDSLSFDDLRGEDFTELAALQPEVVLLGTGDRLRFPHPRLTRMLAEARIGVEVMDIPAACRTYNILMAEERKVAAALLFDRVG